MKPEMWNNAFGHKPHVDLIKSKLEVVRAALTNVGRFTDLQFPTALHVRGTHYVCYAVYC
jgi:hypothetical protein